MGNKNSKGLNPVVFSNNLRDDLSSFFGASFITDVERANGFWPDISTTEAAGFSLWKSHLKKLSTGRTKQTDDRAQAKFLQCNEACKSWSLPSLTTSWQDVLLGEFRRALWEFWHKDGQPILDHPYEFLSRGRVGPGVSIGSSGNSFYAKLFSSRLTCTSSSLYHWYRRYIKSFPEWSNAENIRTENYGSASIVSSSRLSFVPKNDEISRCICIEPTLNGFAQLGFGAVLESRLSERFGIALPTQQLKNRNLARLGSITDEVVTIDLSSASDRISLKMLKQFLPTDFYRWLEFLRCPYVEIKGLGTTELHMVSTMGNGYTFPLQTMLFSCAVVAALRSRGNPVTGPLSDYLCAINGDDIICPTYVWRDVVWLLEALGFAVNHDKTFVEGPFRESCGADYFRGQDIRGVYVKSLHSSQDRFHVTNQLIAFSTKVRIPLWRSIGLLVHSVPWRPVPRWENSDSGIRMPLRACRQELDWDNELQAYSYKASVPKSQYVCYAEDHIVVPRRHKPLVYNPSGLFISFLHGSISSGRSGVRENDAPLYQTKRRYAHNWDYVPSAVPGEPLYGLDWQRWESVAHAASKDA